MNFSLIICCEKFSLDAIFVLCATVPVIFYHRKSHWYHHMLFEFCWYMAGRTVNHLLKSQRYETSHNCILFILWLSADAKRDWYYSLQDMISYAPYLYSLAHFHHHQVACPLREPGCFHGLPLWRMILHLTVGWMWTKVEMFKIITYSW